MAPRSRNALQIFGTGGFGLVINNQSSAFGISGLHATSAILIARSQTTGIFSQWFTGIGCQQDTIVPGSANEFMLINGSSVIGNAYTGIRMASNLTVGIDLSNANFTTTPFLIPNQTTGFGVPTGNSVISNFPGATATLAQTSASVSEILTILKSLGFIGN